MTIALRNLYNLDSLSEISYNLCVDSSGFSSLSTVYYEIIR